MSLIRSRRWRAGVSTTFPHRIIGTINPNAIGLTPADYAETRSLDTNVRLSHSQGVSLLLLPDRSFLSIGTAAESYPIYSMARLRPDGSIVWQKGASKYLGGSFSGAAMLPTGNIFVAASFAAAIIDSETGDPIRFVLSLATRIVAT